jgi:peptidoglycan hydrolase-like protein with peptidoglycan-binding domain
MVKTNKNLNKQTIMFTKKNIWLLSAGLIILNVFLGGTLLLSQYFSQSQQTSISQEEQAKQEVLGIQSNIPKFSPSYVMSNTTFSSTRAFPSQQSVQDYLNRIGSPLATYSDQGQPAAYWIFGAARGQTSSKYGVVPNINPGVLMAYLEKEQSLLSLRGYDMNADPEKRLKTALGYGCPDTAACDTQYFGLGNQLSWAAYQLQYNYNNSTKANFSHQVNKTINTLDGYNVFLSNEATAAQYRYTPHVYWGNYNLWKIITANGWGTDSTTWSMADIDRVNIAKIDTPEGYDTDRINPADVQVLLRSTFTQGESGGRVILLQRFLRQQGYFTYSEITGTFGNITKNALEQYRKDKGVVLDLTTGIDCNAIYRKEYNIGDTSDEIKALQECLRAGGWFDYPTSTGYFGNLTSAGLEKARAATGARPGTGTPTPPAPVSNKVNPCDSLRTQRWDIGLQGERVVQLQECMRKVGTFTYPTSTGYFGPISQQALNKWLEQTGEKPVLEVVPAPAPTPTPAPTPQNPCETLKTQTFEYGERSDRVKTLQQCMKDSGFFTYPYITGYFGSATQDAYTRWKGRTQVAIDCLELKKAEYFIGETSDRVKQLQGCMRQAGVFSFPTDTGYFGSVTKASIIKWRGYF